MKSTAILIVSCNHRERTLQSLASAFNQIALLSSDRQYSFDVYYVDDASRDGSAEAVSEKFPQVKLIRNREKVYWNRGLHQAWEAAGDDYDFYLWLRGDVTLKDNAISLLLDISSHLGDCDIVVGSVEGPAGKILYGGRTLKGRHLIKPDKDIPVPCDVFDGSLVLVPSKAFKALGKNDSYYRHSLGDFDYGARALKMKIDSVIAPGILAETSHRPEKPAWEDPSASLSKRYSSTLGPKDRPFSEQFRYNSRSRNIFYATYRHIRLMLTVLAPNITKKLFKFI